MSIRSSNLLFDRNPIKFQPPERYFLPESRTYHPARTTEVEQRAEGQHLHGQQVCLCHLTCEWGIIQREGLPDLQWHIRHKEKILKLLDAHWEPKEVLVIHCSRHHKGGTKEAKVTGEHIRQLRE